MEEIASKLQEARHTAKLTQEEVAQRLFVTRQAVSRWEQGKTLPNIYVLKDLSSIYQVDLYYFLGEMDSRKKRVNIWALIGILVFNLYFLTTVGIFLLFCMLVIWTYVSLFLISPLAYFFNKGQMAIYLLPNRTIRADLGICILLFVIGLAALPLTLRITKQVWQLVKRYVRYNIKSIYH